MIWIQICKNLRNHHSTTTYLHTFSRRVIPVVCRINQTIRYMRISSNTTNRLGSMLFTICKSRLRVSATNVGLYNWLIFFHCTNLRWPIFVAETCSCDLHIVNSTTPNLLVVFDDILIYLIVWIHYTLFKTLYNWLLKLGALLY